MEQWEFSVIRPENMHVAMVFRHKHAKSIMARIEEVERFKRLTRSTRVNAFEEVSLDHTEPMKYRSCQVNFLHKLLPAVENRHVHMLHCRGMKGACGTVATF